MGGGLEVIILILEEIIARLDAADGEIGAASYLMPWTVPAGEIARRGKYLAEVKRILRVLRHDLACQIARGEQE